MIPTSPTMLSVASKGGLLRQQKSTQQAMDGNLSYGQPTGSKDSTGVFNEFQQDNISNNIFRIGANGSTDNQYSWNGSGVVTIAHGLMRQPIGFKILDKDGTCDIYRTGGAPTDTYITLTCSVNSVNATVEIF